MLALLKGAMALNNSPTVSVLLPVYNSENYLSRCLDSIFGQTFHDFELIAIDDGSSDHSPAILDRYQERHPDTMHVVHQQNSGVAVTRNRAIKMARGTWIALIDNDDWFDDDYLETLLSYARDDADIVFSGYRRPDEHGRVVSSLSVSEDVPWAPFAVQAGWAKIYRRQFLLNRQLEFLPTNIGEDLFLTIPAAFLGEGVLTPYCGYNWFYNTASVSNTSQKTSEGLDIVGTCEQISNKLEGADIDRALLSYILARYLTYCIFYMAKGDGARLSIVNAKRYAAWLDGHLPLWRTSYHAKSSKGDLLSARFGLFLFARIPPLFYLAISIYSKL